MDEDSPAPAATLFPDTLDINGAAPALRDEFLCAIDTANLAHPRRIASHLTRCRNPLPGMVCVALSLAHGSAYGRAARLVLRNQFPRANTHA